MEIYNDWKDKYKNAKMCFFIEQIGGAMRICMAHDIQEAIEKFDSIGLKYGYKANINNIIMKSGDEIINVGAINSFF